VARPTAAAKDHLAAVLGEVRAPGSFSAQRKAPAGDLHLEVRGLGPLTLPVPEAQARQLCQLARPAQYGKGEQTLLDRRVRDTWEIPKSRVKLDKRAWNRTLLPVLEGLRADLGLPPGSRLRAEWHSMLVYAPGQFFVPHQDSEKDDSMVGSLVVTLPSTFKGGALVVRHGGETATYTSPGKSLSFVAFYADCHHEVKPVTAGYRVVLTYNLLVEDGAGTAAPADAPPEVLDALARCLDEHFTADGNRLVYLLDHEYTARSLGWSQLKGTDARRATALRQAAARAGCEVVLALADVHETWSCFETGWDRDRYSRGYRRWDEDDDEEDDIHDGDDYELDELIETEIGLDCWIGPGGGQADPIVTSVGDDEVCATTPSAELQPYASEYEGYMGNWGNTMDRWYHRGALVLWPRWAAFAVRAEASPGWALDQLSARLRAGDVASAQEMVGELAPFWSHAGDDQLRRRRMTTALRVASGIDEPELAALLLGPFRVEMLTVRQAAAWVALVHRYGEEWTGRLLASWWARAERWPPDGGSRIDWVASLARLYEAMRPAASPAATLLVETSWRWLRGAVESRLTLMPPSRRDEALLALAPPILAVLESAAVTAATLLRDEVLEYLCSRSDDLLLACLMAVLRSARPPGPPGLDVLARHCQARLEARLARPPRAGDDWSIDDFDGCGCQLCAVLGSFLADPQRRALEWPLAKDRRAHVHARIDRAELPVRHETRRTGRPYTLVLTKTAETVERHRRARQRDEADLAWLGGRSWT
jgi:hypothetical protein